MNETNSLEAQLHSWQPRRPSAALKRRLFAEPINLMPRMAWLVGWLVPATACAVLTFSVFTSGSDLSVRSSRGTGLSSQWNYLTSIPDSSRQGANNVASVTFDVTNHNGLASDYSGFQSSRTN